jgi:GR25 family glycosyltransferase involved in LPS biosynthesis
MGTQLTTPGTSVYVISLDDSSTRRQNMTERLGALGIPFQFVNAIDSRGPLADVFDGASVKRFGDIRSICCTLSHRLVHRIIAEGVDPALILEDDAVLSQDFSEVLTASEKLNFDVLKLEGGRHHRRYVSVERLGKYSVEVGMVPSLGSAAYLITPSAALRFCDLAAIDQPPDIAFGDPRLRLRVLELDPFPAVQEHRISNTPVEWHDAGLPFLSKLANSVTKRWRLAQAHGFWMVAAMERTRFRKH